MIMLGIVGLVFLLYYFVLLAGDRIVLMTGRIVLICVEIYKVFFSFRLLWLLFDQLFFYVFSFFIILFRLVGLWSVRLTLKLDSPVSLFLIVFLLAIFLYWRLLLLYFWRIDSFLLFVVVFDLFLVFHILLKIQRFNKLIFLIQDNFNKSAFPLTQPCTEISENEFH